ncbi:hypothetical protein RRG08_017429 [Elysia crispata]|uniref:Uncharacterized protein n=1 Tax=Elysia crispata TaxID=231223 RepID=A0AAE1B572_9GAST|nr:hypothetical protein RRG08_017429 [Elysia crispata]
MAGTKQLGIFTKTGMSNILCASFCCLNSQCDLYHFNTVNSVCATFEKPSSFRLAADLLSDPDWSTGYIHDISSQDTDIWTLVFRAQSRVGVSVYDTWTDTSLEHDNPLPEDFPRACLRLTDYAQCDRHFRSHSLNNWRNIQEVGSILVILLDIFFNVVN